MNNKSFTSLLLTSSLLVSASAFADHNSVNGEGWANKPNDIHNTRIDTMDSDTSIFTDFVRYGAGADSVNRFATDDDRSVTETQRPTTDAVSQRVARPTTQSRRPVDVSRMSRASASRAVVSRGRR